MATWNSRGLRGSTLEEFINHTNTRYSEMGLALIQKIPTPITPVRIDKEHRHITLAYFDKISTVDYIGAVQGIPVCFDAKECNADTFPLQNVHEHQIHFMEKFEQQGGISFLLIYFTAREELYYMQYRQIRRFWDRAEDGGRKSFRLDELEPKALGAAVTSEDVAKVIELWTGIPASKIKESELNKVARLEETLKKKIIGQDEAVELVASAVRRSRVQISARRRPASFIFVGPTGVGKTELVKVLSHELFDTPDALIRLDMSEFMEKHSVSRIIGSPPGYVGYDEAGQLTEKGRRKPYSVVLFDEIEKAHPDVLNVLLQILDDGRITDAQGRTVNFENTVIVMTTNAGSNRKGGAMGFGGTVSDMGRERALKALGEFLRPEFINRVDEIVYFNSLTEENFRSIAELMLEETRDAIAERGISMTWNTALIDYLVRKSYSVTYGARNLRRTIQKDVEDAIAQKIIDCRGENAGHISVSADDNGVVVEVSE